MARHIWGYISSVSLEILLWFLHEGLQHHCLEAEWMKANITLQCIFNWISTIRTGCSFTIIHWKQEWANLSLSLGLIFFQCFFTLNLSITAADWRIWEVKSGKDFRRAYSHHTHISWYHRINPFSLSHSHSLTLSHTHTQYLRVLGATHYSTQGWYNGWVFESLLQLGCGLKGDKRDLTKLAGCHK